MLVINTASRPWSLLQPGHQPKPLLNKHYGATQGRGISQGFGGEGEKTMAQKGALVEEMF